jgi:hypothetical protein
MSVDWRRRFLRAALVAPLIVAGCIERTVNEGVTTYRFAWWVMTALAVGGAVSIFSARFVPTRTDGWYRYTRKIRWGLISTGVIAWFLIVVTYFQKVTVSPDGFTEHLGFFGQKLHQVTYRDLRQVEFISEVYGIGRSRKTNYFFVCFGKEGTQDKVPLSGSCMQAALPEIMRGITAAEVSIVDKSKDNSQF